MAQFLIHILICICYRVRIDLPRSNFILGISQLKIFVTNPYLKQRLYRETIFFVSAAPLQQVKEKFVNVCLL